MDSITLKPAGRCIMVEYGTEELQGTPKKKKEPGTCALIPCQARVTPDLAEKNWLIYFIRYLLFIYMNVTDQFIFSMAVHILGSPNRWGLGVNNMNVAGALFKPNWTTTKLIMPIPGPESSLVYVLLFDVYLMVIRSQVNLREHYRSLQLIKQVMNSRQRVFVLDSHLLNLL